MDTDAPVAQQSWIRLIHDRNPFFLLSAACMMTGCVVLNGALFVPGGSVESLLTVLAVINVYEFALIGLSGLLVRREGPVSRDARMLAALETMFLADGTFSVGAIATVDANWGWGVSAALLILGALKLTAVMAILRIPHRRWLVGVVLLQLALLLAAPTLFRHMVEQDQGFLLPRALYAGCWVIGAVATAAGLVIAPRAGALFAPGRPRSVLALYLLVPFASVLLHVFSAIAIYQLDFVGPYLTPVLLGLAVVAESFAPFMRTPRIRGYQVILLAAAILASLSGPPELTFKPGSIELSPLRLALLGSAAVVLWMLWRYKLRYFCIGLAAMVIAAVLGTNWRVVLGALERAFNWLNDLLSRLLPKPAIRWGVVAILAAFAFLGIGAFFSLRRRSPKPAPPGTASASRTSSPGSTE